MIGSIAAIGLTLCLIVITTLAIFGWVPITRVAFESRWEPASVSAGLSAVIIAGVAVLFGIALPILAMTIAARKKWVNWKTLAFGWLAVLPVLGWLTTDDVAIRHPLTMEELSPPFPGADQSFALLMRFSKKSAEMKTFDAITWTTPTTINWNTREAGPWKEMVQKERAHIAADWARLAPYRQWMEELATHERIGDLTPSRLDAEIVGFRVWRILAQRTCAVATLQAIDGQGDDAIATLLPLLKTGHRLQPNARTLVRAMIGVVVERMAIETALMVADLTPLSPATRAQLNSAIANDQPGQMARRFLLIEYAIFFPAFIKHGLGDHLISGNGWINRATRRVINQFSGLVFLPNATTNIYGERVYALGALAEKRALGEFSIMSKGFDTTLRTQPGLRNIGGRLTMNMASPAYDKVLDSYWKLADLREVLRKRTAG